MTHHLKIQPDITKRYEAAQSVSRYGATTVYRAMPSAIR